MTGGAAMSGMVDDRLIAGGPAVREEYEAWLECEFQAWLERLRMTYESVAHCCSYRLEHDRGAAERVSMRVIAGLLAKPRVLQYHGLPFSGRVSHLAQVGIAEWQRGEVLAGGTWEEVRAALEQLSRDEKEIVVLTCVDGRDDAQLAAALGCDEPVAAARREAAFRRLNDLGGGKPAPAPA
jgi:DNA-directed RNA polymerase specialized sigma24 family protein